MCKKSMAKPAAIKGVSEKCAKWVKGDKSYKLLSVKSWGYNVQLGDSVVSNIVLHI